MQPIKLAVLISGSGSNLQAIIDAIESGRLNAQICAVISNRPAAYGLQRAQQHGIQAIALDHTEFDTREQFDIELQKTIDALNVDYIVLAGYMRILSTQIIEHFYPRMLNIHPSLLPKYQGLHTHQRALDNHDNEHGVSIHIVTPELDAGPVIIQGKFTIDVHDNADSLQQKAHKLEHQMYPLVLKWLGEQRLKLTADTLLFDDEVLQHPLLFNDLTNAC
jgi:phosphoribosylglycinamide formyltransferase-1